MVNEDWDKAEQENVALGNPQPLILWQRRDGAQIQVRMGLKLGFARIMIKKVSLEPQLCVTHGNPQTIISWQRPDRSSNTDWSRVNISGMFGL
jgi:hypothetical protein